MSEEELSRWAAAMAKKRLDTEVLIAELRLRIPEVEKTIERLEDAQAVSQESLRLEINI